MTMDCNRRDFMKTVSAAALISNSVPAEAAAAATEPDKVDAGLALNLEPAQWIWYPSQRCLPNTIVLFRKTISLAQPVRKALGWMVVDSRYKLFVNGRYVQFGPPPCDPRWLEADPMDLGAGLHKGDNVLAVQALYYGLGDGTSPMGKAGFIFKLELEFSDGSQQTVVSDDSWLCCLPRSWQPGQYKRWYLRSLQEEFDSRRHPHGWEQTTFQPDQDWVHAMLLHGRSDKPSINTRYPEYMWDISGSASPGNQLRKRSIPLMREENVAVWKLSETHLIRWNRPVEEYFECMPPDAFASVGKPALQAVNGNTWLVTLDSSHGTALTFEFKDHIVGWPFFTIMAPAGTVVELLVHEAHAADGPVILNTHFNSWSRFVCREGENRFETFDFESLRWLQLHIHAGQGQVEISEIGVRRRQYPWPASSHVVMQEAGLQRLMDANVNTLHNSCQETMVDGMARERQQYSGDCGHQLHAVYYAFGEKKLLARYLNTFSQGMTLDGFFLDCWPAWDRLARLLERQMNLTGWGPILDHGVGFNFDTCYYYLYTADLASISEVYPRLVKFFRYLLSIRDQNGLLPVENIGIPSVWIDHIAYQKQRHKQCAFNLYAAAMMQHAFKPLAEAFGDQAMAKEADRAGRQILQATVKKFWSEENKLFVDNLPWLEDEGQMRTSDRALATAVLYEQIPFGQSEAAIRALAECPSHMGFSYPANAGWRLWALARAGRTDVIAKDFRTRWATMASVILNNTLQEDWEVKPDSGSQWSHCPVVPLYVLYMNIIGLQPLQPGCGRMAIQPQLADMPDMDVVANTVKGAIRFVSKKVKNKHEVTIHIPAGMEAELLLAATEKVSLPLLATADQLNKYKLSSGKANTVTLAGRAG